MSDQYRDALLDLLPGCNLPDELVAWLVQGLEVQRAGGDLAEALGLAGADKDRRDDLLRTVVSLSPGESVSARCSYLVECLDGDQQHPRIDMQNVVERLRLLSVPRSMNQLRRIVKHNRRQDGWRFEQP